MTSFRRLLCSMPLLLLLLLVVSMLQLQVQRVDAQLASATLTRFSGQYQFVSRQSVNTTDFQTLPYPQQLPVMHAPGLTITLNTANSSYTSGGATVSCGYAICFQTLVRSTPDWTVWPYGGCVSMGTNDTGYYTNLANPQSYGYNANNTLPAPGTAFSLPTKAGPFHVSIATIVGSNAPTSNPGGQCEIAFTIDTNNNACIYDGEVAYMNQCTNLTYNVQNSAINTTLSTGGFTPPSNSPSLMIGFTPSTPWINTISLEVISATGNSGDNTTIHGEQGAGFVGNNNYQPGLQNFTRTANNVAANNTVTVQTPVYRSADASVLERTAYVFSVDPVTQNGNASYSSITAHQYNCSVGAIGLINGQGCAVSTRQGNLYAYPYGTVQQIGITGANFAGNQLFYTQLIFYDEPGQSSFQVGAIPFGGNQAQMYIRKGGLPTPLVYDAYVNTSIPGNNQNGIFYDSGVTTLDGTPWYIGYGVNARAVQFVTQGEAIERSYSEQHLHNQHLFSSASHSFYDSPASEMQHRSEYAVNRAVIDDMMHRLNKTAGYNHSSSTITTSHERGRIQLDSKHTTSSSYSTQDWTQGLTLSFYSGASCINNCSYSSNNGNGFCNLNTHQCTCTNNWRSIDCSQYSPYSDHILSSVEKIVLPIVACLGSFLLGVALCLWLRRLPYRGYNQMGGADGGLPGTGYALGTGAAVQGGRAPVRSTATTAARPAAPAATSQSAAPAAGGGTARQAGTRLGRGANVHGFAAGH